VAQNTNAEYSSPDVSGQFTSQGYNLIGQSNGSGGFADGVNADLVGSTNAPLNPLLGPLTNNGGPTFTIALLPGSPALDAGDDALLAAPLNLLTDQRGLPRKSGAHVDIGAYERQALLITALARSGNDVRISFVAELGSSYRIERKDDLAAGDWTTVADSLVGTGGVVQVTDPGAASQPKRFYRGFTLP